MSDNQSTTQDNGKVARSLNNLSKGSLLTSISIVFLVIAVFATTTILSINLRDHREWSYDNRDALNTNFEVVAERLNDHQKRIEAIEAREGYQSAASIWDSFSIIWQDINRSWSVATSYPYTEEEDGHIIEANQALNEARGALSDLGDEIDTSGDSWMAGGSAYQHLADIREISLTISWLLYDGNLSEEDADQIIPLLNQLTGLFESLGDPFEEAN